MRIGILHNYTLTRSGSSVYIRMLAKALANLGHSVHVICFEEKPKEYPDVVSKAYVYGDHGRVQSYMHRIGIHHVTVHTHPGITPMAAYPREDLPGSIIVNEADERTIERFLKEMTTFVASVADVERLDVLIANHAVLLPAIAARVGLPTIVIPHGTTLPFLKTNELLREHAANGFRHASAIIALNASVRERIIDTGCVDAAKTIVVIPPGVNTKVFTYQFDPRNEHVLSDHGIFIGGASNFVTYHGQLRRAKGVHNLVVAMIDVLTSRPKTRLVIAGDGDGRPVIAQIIDAIDRDDRTYFQSIIDRNGLRDLAQLDEERIKECFMYGKFVLRSTVIFTGYCSQHQLSLLLPHAAVAVVPSIEEEAFPIVLLEALSAGAIPVGMDHSGIAEALTLIENECPELKGVMRIDPHEPILSMSAQITRALNLLVLERLPDIRGRLHEIVRRTFDWSVIAGQIAALCENVLSGSSSTERSSEQ